MRPSSPTRRLPIDQTAQYKLPFAAETEVLSPSVEIDHTGNAEVELGDRSTTRRSRGQTIAPPVGAIESAKLLDQNSPKRITKRKPPATVDVPPDSKLLVSRKAAAAIVSLSLRKIDSLLASKQLPFRKIGTRTLIPLSALQRFARMDHPERIAG